MTDAGSSSAFESASAAQRPSTTGPPLQESLVKTDSSPLSEYDSATDISETECADTDGFEPYQSKKRRKRKGSGSSDETMHPPRSSHGLVVIFQPTDPKILVKTFNAIKLTNALEANCPDGIINIRPNLRLNLLAVDTRNNETTSTLLRITQLCGVPVKVYEPRLPNMAVGVIHGIPLDITEKQLLDALSSTTDFVRVRRLGLSESIALTFASQTLPADVTVGYVRYKTHLYVEQPTQCKLCGRLGHVVATCRSSLSCVRCGKKHETKDCTSPEPHCVNCGRKHTSSSHYCPKWREEKSVVKYRRLNHVDYPTARAALKESDKPVPSKLQQPAHPIQSITTGATNHHQLQMEQPPPDPHDMNTFPPISEPARPPTTEGHHTTANPKRTTRTAEKRLTQQQQSSRSRPSQPHPALPARSGLGSFISAAINALRGLLRHISTPTATAFLQLIDTLYPLLQGLIP